MIDDPTDKWLEEYLNTKPDEKPKIHVPMHIEEGFSDCSAEEWARAHGMIWSEETLTLENSNPDGTNVCLAQIRPEEVA